MKNRVAATLGHSRKLTRRSNHRKRPSFKRKVKSYLKANYFLYAPLVSRHQPSDLSPPSKTVDSSAAAGFRRNETSRTQKKKKLLQRILEYLKSDSHMYAALIDSPIIDSPKKADPASGPVHHIEKLSIAISRRMITTATHKPTPDHVKKVTNGVSEGEAIRQSRRYRISSDSGAMNRELRRLLT